jgi:hypothetical protein
LYFAALASLSTISKVFGMKKSLFVFAALIFVMQVAALAQDWSYGFRAGLSFGKQIGPAEAGETFDYNSGFHIALGFGRSFTDLWGLRGELQYSQKGTRQKFEGSSYLSLIADSGNRYTFAGSKKLTLANYNSYIDVPVVVYARVAKWLEVSGGLYAGVNIVSTGNGELNFSSDALDAPLSVELDHNYIGDEAGEADLSGARIVKTKSGGEQFKVPTVAGAYFFQTAKPANFYQVLDYGLVGGLSFYINRGLFLGGRLVYGLADPTNDDADFSLLGQASGISVSRADKDRNLVIQTSVGFNF